ncbi:MAG TPA: hypothetical protein VEU30_00285 [Thermoanaerobaculia bacterium]|nr:hypothetical protein [Thermoanaerobaculia bacterium]
MGHGIEQLDGRQRQFFEEALSRYGMNVSDVYSDDLVVGGGPRPTYWNGSPSDDCPFAPKILRTNNLDEAKRWLGIPDERFRRGDFPRVEALPTRPWWGAPKANFASLSQADQNEIVRAAKAYVWGDSKDVADYKTAIEEFLGPFRVNVYAAQNITVTPSQPWIINSSSPSVITVGTVTIEQGGQIVVSAVVTINASQVTAQ